MWMYRSGKRYLEEHVFCDTVRLAVVLLSHKPVSIWAIWNPEHVSWVPKLMRLSEGNVQDWALDLHLHVGALDGSFCALRLRTVWYGQLAMFLEAEKMNFGLCNKF